MRRGADGRGHSGRYADERRADARGRCRAPDGTLEELRFIEGGKGGVIETL